MKAIDVLMWSSAAIGAAGAMAVLAIALDIVVDIIKGQIKK